MKAEPLNRYIVESLNRSCRGDEAVGADQATNPEIHQKTASLPRQLRAPGFTLIELLVVISIIAILTAIALPVTHQFKPDPVAAASRQLMDDFALARRRAIADHTTVYVLFMPSTSNLTNNFASLVDTNTLQHLANGQYSTYALYEKR